VAVGIQSSILMSESLEGLSVAATRQNAGNPLNVRGSSAAASVLGGNAPAATSPASVIVTFGSARVPSLSHEVAAAMVCRGIVAASANAQRTPAKIFIRPRLSTSGRRTLQVRLKPDATYEVRL